jgi:NAD(P)-dependent dehydrogenase (short-subunit alcohol dehydrogenase family)
LITNPVTPPSSHRHPVSRIARLDAVDPFDMPVEAVTHFGEQVPMKRPAQPCELAPVYVMLASEEARYVSGATIAVTGGKPII